MKVSRTNCSAVERCCYNCKRVSSTCVAVKALVRGIAFQLKIETRAVPRKVRPLTSARGLEQTEVYCLEIYLPHRPLSVTGMDASMGKSIETRFFSVAYGQVAMWPDEGLMSLSVYNHCQSKSQCV